MPFAVQSPFIGRRVPVVDNGVPILYARYSSVEDILLVSSQQHQRSYDIMCFALGLPSDLLLPAQRNQVLLLLLLLATVTAATAAAVP
jgi:hypothetical protein